MTHNTLLIEENNQHHFGFAVHRACFFCTAYIKCDMHKLRRR